MPKIQIKANANVSPKYDATAGRDKTPAPTVPVIRVKIDPRMPPWVTGLKFLAKKFRSLIYSTRLMVDFVIVLYFGSTSMSVKSKSS